jgi:signal transduction histidine kinase
MDVTRASLHAYRSGRILQVDPTSALDGRSSLMRRRLTPHILIAAALVVVVTAIAFGALVQAIDDEHDASAHARAMRSELTEAHALERLLLELDSDVRSLAAGATSSSRAQLDARIVELRARSEVVDDTDRSRVVGPALAVEALVDDYLDQRLAAIVAAAGVVPPGDVAAAVTAADDARDPVTAGFEAYRRAANDELVARQAESDRATERGVRLAVAGVVVLVGLVGGFVVYLERRVLRPLRRAARMADRLAAGDLSARMPETGPAEIGALAHSFDTMASSLEAARSDLLDIVTEQTSLHQVASLVARGATPDEVFGVVCSSVRGVLRADLVLLLRFDPGTVATVLARDGDASGIDPGSRWSMSGVDLPAVFLSESGDVRPVRITAAQATTDLARAVRKEGMTAATVAPIVVEGDLWGAVVAGWTDPTGGPTDPGAQTASFTELVATAIANVETRAELVASRARVVAAADDARRRIERDLHDGIQQRLIAIGLELRLAQSLIPADASAFAADLDRISDRLSETVEELQEVARGIHPAILNQGGLVPAIRSIGRRSAVPTTIRAPAIEWLPAQVEVTAYYVVAEAVTNAMKHAEASGIDVVVDLTDGTLGLSVRDDGIGGADAAGGSGLVGLRDRVEAAGGRINVRSDVGAGTCIDVAIPVNQEA